MKKHLFAIGLAISFSLSTTILHAKTNAEIPLDEIRNFVDVYNTIRNEYVEEKDGKKLIDYAIKGMLKGLDPHSVYLKKKDIEELKDDTSGSYVGFGVQLDIINNKLIIITPIPNSPAEAAGLKPNDHIVKIGDTIIENMSMKAVSDLLKANDSVTFTIMRKGEETKQYDLSKSTVNLPSVNHKVFSDKYGYIRVTQFQLDTAEQFKQSLSALLNDNVEGVVLDLRNNPGGLIMSATAIADHFLDAGLIVSTKNQNTGSEDKIHANEQTLAKTTPLVVLINEGSASASELLAGALQSHKRAVIVGQRSFGKGSVQTIIPLSNGNGVKLTTARYYTPNSESIQARGITPDIVLNQLTVDDKNISLLSYGEADIPNHLAGEEDKSRKKNITNRTDDDVSELAKSDLQLFEALNVLKVLIFKQ